MSIFQNKSFWLTESGLVLSDFTIYAILYYPTNQSFNLSPACLHTVTLQQHYQKLVLSSFAHLFAAGSQARSGIGSYASFDTTPSLPKHLIGILPLQITFFNLTPPILQLLLVIIQTIICLCTNNLSKCRVFHRPHAQFSNILCRRYIVNIGEAMRISPGSTSQSQFSSDLIHLMNINPHYIFIFLYQVTYLLATVNKTFIQFSLFVQVEYGSTDLSDLMGCIITTWQHHTIKKILKTDFNPRLQLSRCANHCARLFCNIESYFVGNQMIFFQNLQDSVKVHYFGEGCYLPFFKVAFSIQIFFFSHLVKHPTVGTQ